MKRVIFSIYIDIEEKDLDEQPPFYRDTIPKTLRTKLKMKEYYPWLKQVQEKYAENNNIKYKLFENDARWISYKTHFNEKYPFITAYNIVNFYKIHLLYELAKEYDEILYLDFDVVPLSNENFFEHWKISKNGMAIKIEDEKARKQIMATSRRYNSAYVTGSNLNLSNRSPIAKHWNTRALLLYTYNKTKHEIFNTGIIGVSAEQLKKIDYFENFDEILEIMTDLKDDDMWPMWMRDVFGWDNETIWSYKIAMNNITYQCLDDNWHHAIYFRNTAPESSHLLHVINKDFEYAKEKYDERNSL